MKNPAGRESAPLFFEHEDHEVHEKGFWPSAIRDLRALRVPNLQRSHPISVMAASRGSANRPPSFRTTFVTNAQRVKTGGGRVSSSS
jgi:hypothetical protein